MVLSAQAGWTPSSTSVWKILGAIKGSWDMTARCPLPVLLGRNVSLNQSKFPAWAVGFTQLFSCDNWSVGCLPLCCCHFLWRKQWAALEAGNTALAGKKLLFLHFLEVLTREHDFRAEVQEICLPSFILTTSFSGLDQRSRQHSSGHRRLCRMREEGGGFMGKEHPIGIKTAKNHHHQ